MRALVLAGGRGTRLRPLTDTRPKPMVPFMGEPYALGLLRRLADGGVERVTFLVGSAQIGSFDRLGGTACALGLDLEVVGEERPLDTAGAARRLLRGSREEDVLVCNGDMLSDVDYAALAATHRDSGATATLAVKRVEDTSSYGVLLLDADGRIEGFLEKPAPGATDRDTVNAGAYVLDASAFDAFAQDGPLSFEYDVFPRLVEDGRYLQGAELPAHWQDLGTPGRFLEGLAAVLGGRCAWPWAPGLEQHTVGSGRAAVHRSADVSDRVSLNDVVVGAHACVEEGAQLSNVALLPGAFVGSGARLSNVIVDTKGRVPAGHALDGQVVADRATAA